MSSRYPRYTDAEWVPWQGDAYYRGMNEPIAVVLHIQQGWQRTYREWAMRGHYRGSVHFSIGRDGHVIQMLDLSDGGYHAGITVEQALKYPPTWPLWRGPYVNVNHYTVGIEHEGFYDELFDGHPFTEAQRQASRKLCRWLADVLNIPWERVRFPAHAEIDVVNRVNDFATPAMREVHYAWMFGQEEREEAMTPEERARLESVEAAVRGIGDLRARLEELGPRIDELARWLRGVNDTANANARAIGELGAQVDDLKVKLRAIGGGGVQADAQTATLKAIAEKLRAIAALIEQGKQ